MPHDFKLFPELTNAQLQFYYFESPHKQIFDDFFARVVKVHDGDTITVKWEERDFDFPVRFLGTNAPELNEEGGSEAQQWLENILLDEEVYIIIDPKQRVDKWGRLLGKIMHKGVDLNEQSMVFGFAKDFESRKEGKIPSLSEFFPEPK